MEKIDLIYLVLTRLPFGLQDLRSLSLVGKVDLLIGETYLMDVVSFLPDLDIWK
jgi:hypothetical protein